MLGRLGHALAFYPKPTKQAFLAWCREFGYRPGPLPDLQLVAMYMGWNDPDHGLLDQAEAARAEWYPRLAGGSHAADARRAVPKDGPDRPVRVLPARAPAGA